MALGSEQGHDYNVKTHGQGVKGSIDRREEPGMNQGLQSIRSILVAALHR